MSNPTRTTRRSTTLPPGSSHRAGWRTIICMLLLISSSLITAQAASAEVRTGTSEARMYVLPNCGYCDRARSHLRARRISFEERNIASDAQAKAEFDQLGGAGTPLIVIGDRVIHGFDPTRIDAALAATLD